MALQFNFILLTTSLSILVITSTCFHVSSAKRVLDEQPPVNPNDPKVVEVAKFAVDERNKEAKTSFELVKVNAGGTVPNPDGLIYQLDISVIESQVSTTRLVAVLVHPDDSKELISFE